MRYISHYLTNITVYADIIGILAYIILFKMFFKTKKRLQSFMVKNYLLEKQLDILKCEYQKLMETMKNNSRQRHDWRHHLLTISSLIQNKNYKSLEKYFNYYITTQSPEDDIPICSNTIVNVILRHFISKSNDANIKITVDVDISNDIAISDLDLSVLFGNTVENAFEACLLQNDGQRFIEIRAKTLGEQLFICIQNSFSILPKHIEEGSYFLDNNGRECIGISSVKSTVESYSGNFAIKVSNNVFTVEILINI